MAEPVRWRTAVALGIVTPPALGAAALLAENPLLGAVGPAAVRTAWIPLALWAASVNLEGFGHGRSAAVLGLAARLATWAVLAAFVADPARNGFDAVAGAAGTAAASAGALVRTAVGGLVGILVLGGLAAILLGGSGGPAARAADDRRPTAVRTGSSLGPVAALALRLAARAAIVLLVAAAWTSLVLLAWTARGTHGAAVALGIREPAASADLVLARLAGLLGRAGTGVTDLLARRAAGWGRQETHGVWITPAAIERGPDGALVALEAWEPAAGESDEARELRELGTGLLAALDVALVSGTLRMRQERDGGPSPYPYRIEIARAWSRPGFHAVVLRGSPSTANALLARATVDLLLPTLDAETSWTAAELRGLRLSDPRVAQDPLRGGERGVFVALDRAAEEEPERATGPAADPGRAAIERALREAGLAGRFRFEAADTGFDADTYEYRASFSTSAEWRELDTAWRGLQAAVSLFARNAGARLDARLEPYGFLCTLPKATPEFPSGEATEWARVGGRLEPVLRRRRLAFVLGLDHRGEPLILELGTETPHLLVAGATGSGKSRSAVFSPLAQLLRLNDPSCLRVTLLDSVKRELTSLFSDAPHVERSVIAEDGDDVVATLEAFTAAMDARYREQAGREFDPVRAAAHLLIVEEWADLRDLLDRDQLERVIRAVNRVGQLGRAAGFHLLLVTQKASAEVIPPRVKTNFKARVAGYLPQASDYGILFDQHRRLLPNVKGRLAVSTDGHTVRVVQGLFIENAAIRELVAGLRRRPAELPAAPLPDAPEPRAPTAREIEALDLLTLARLVYRWQAELDEPLVVSVRSMIDRVRSLGYTPGRAERYTAGLAGLEAHGILGRVGEGSQSPRRLLGLAWEDAAHRISRMSPSVSFPDPRLASP